MRGKFDFPLNFCYNKIKGEANGKIITCLVNYFYAFF